MAFNMTAQELDNCSFIEDIETETEMGGLLSNQDRELINLVNRDVCRTIFLLFGLVSNIINIAIYKSIGLQDSVSINYFFLSISDMCYLSLNAFTTICHFWLDQINSRFLAPRKVHEISLTFLLIWYSGIFYDMSMLTTTFLAIQRYCCVAWPFKFKDIFTRRRSIIVICCIYAYVIVTYASVLAMQGLSPLFLPQNNVTLYVLWFHQYRATADDVFQTLNRVIVPNVAQILIFASLIGLASTLTKASTNRRMMTGLRDTAQPRRKDGRSEEDGRREISGISTEFSSQDYGKTTTTSCEKFEDSPGDQDQFSTTSKVTSFEKTQHPNKTRITSIEPTQHHPPMTRRVVIDDDNAVTMTTPTKHGVRGAASTRLSGRELRVVICVSLVAGLFLVCNLPANALFYVTRFEPEFDLAGLYENMFMVCYGVRTTVEIIGASINIFIYYHFNTKYREKLNSCFSFCKRRQER